MLKYLVTLALVSLDPKVADCINLERLEVQQISEGLALAQSLATIESQAFENCEKGNKNGDRDPNEKRPDFDREEWEKEKKR